MQFLIESATIAAVGGALGVILGISWRNCQLDHFAAELRADLVGAHGTDRGHQRRIILRRLSGSQGGAARSGCGAEVRVEMGES